MALGTLLLLRWQLLFEFFLQDLDQARLVTTINVFDIENADFRRAGRIHADEPQRMRLFHHVDAVRPTQQRFADRVAARRVDACVLHVDDDTARFRKAGKDTRCRGTAMQGLGAHKQAVHFYRFRADLYIESIVKVYRR